MRLLRGQPAMAAALVSADISKSQALAIAEWTRKLPAELRAETITILVQAAQAGASLDDLRMIAGVALERWRASRPDADEDGFDDRYVQAATTFGGAGVHPRQPDPGMRRRGAGGAGGAGEEGRRRGSPGPRGSGSMTRCRPAVSC